MQQIGTTKSLFYGAVMVIIFMISSCEFGLTGSDISQKSPQISKLASNT